MAEYTITWRPWLLSGVALLVTIFGCRPADAQMCPVLGCYGCGDVSVSCSAAQLTAFPQFAIADQQIIEELDLSANMLTTLTRNNLQNYTALKELDISANMLTLIEPGTFSVTQRLEILILDDNGLQTIPENLFINTSLRELHFSSNRIENISRAFFAGLDPSAKIYLYGNQIQTIPENALPTTFSQLHLTDNPLNCDCGLRWVPDYIDSLDPSAVFDTGMCESPASLQGMELSSLMESQFTCECSPECVNGSCNLALGTCVCDFGFTGDDCSSNACTDGAQNYGETDVDCGGPLCPPCYLGQACSSDEDCGNATVCLGTYSHPSGLSYPFRIIDNLHCVNEKFPGEELLQKFKDAFSGREEALNMIDPLANLTEIKRNVQKEIELQFEIEEPLEAVIISDLDREPGNPLYQTCIQWSGRVADDTVESDMQRMVQNMHNGKLKGTLIIRRENKKVVMNI